MYSQFTPETDHFQTVFDYKNAKGNFDLVGKPKKVHIKKVYNDIFEVDEYYFAKRLSSSKSKKLPIQK